LLDSGDFEKKTLDLISKIAIIKVHFLTFQKAPVEGYAFPSPPGTGKRKQGLFIAAKSVGG